PYYWCVDKDGNQLPFIDTITYTTVQDPEVMKLSFQQGKVDFVLTSHTPITIADYAGLKQSEQRSGLEVRFWDSGSGSASAIFFNLDHKDEAMRKLVREAKFRQALSHAYNRKDVQKSVYYNTGELTTGTLSPKGYNFNINAEARRRYVEWRDSYVEYNPDKAKRMLDELGLKDRDGDGFREMPDGSKLTVTLDYHADAAREHVSKNNLLARDWKAVGINAKPNPVPPTAFSDRWTSGQLLTNSDWGIGDNNPLIYPGWVVPVSSEHWAPLHGQWFTLRGTPAEKQQLNVDPWKRQPPRIGPLDKQDFYQPAQRLWQLYDAARVETDTLQRTKLIWDIFRVHVQQGPYITGVVANFPRAVLVRRGLKNVPTSADLKKYALGGWTDPWIIPCPAVYDPETFYYEDPSAHA
ncbi:MAG: ABC transporter substrate-binding protein, partial [Chloroflexota bacterium]|nr:ABC transporter substrate-binding protein [Chloroflexota bacterium]